MGRKRNWDRIQKQDPKDSVRYRDVYEDQQLERSKVPEKQSPVSRIVLVSILTVLVMFITYIVISLFQMVGMMWQSSMGSALGSSGSAIVSETDVGTDDTIDGTSSGESTSSNGSGVASVIQNDENWQAGVESGKYDARLLENPTISWEEYKTEYYTATDEYEYTKQKIGCNIVYIDKATGQVYNASEVDIRYKETLAAMNAISAPKTDDVVTEPNDIEVSEVAETTEPVVSDGIGWGWLLPNKVKVFITLIVGLGFFGILYQYMMRNLEAQNLMSDTSDINQYSNDQHIALPEEVQRKFDWFPDVGAHCPVMVSSMISHVMLQNKGLNKIQMAKRAEKDILDEDGNIEYFKGEVLENDAGEPLMMTVPLIDEKFGVALFDASDALDDKLIRKTYDTTKIPYNPGNKNRNKLKDAESVADMINKYWTFPDYEPQRPAGAYLVDTEPVNTMV